MPISFLLTDPEKEELIHLIETGQPIPEKWRYRLFSNVPNSMDIGKEYRLVYDGKLRREEVLAKTPAAPWQLVRRFCTDHPCKDGWHNLLVWGDNLLALRELLADQKGPNHFGTKDKIKLIYIDPPFATRQDFMRDKEKAYQDKVIGAQFIEFLRHRLILLHEILANDGCLYIHLDWKKGHYVKTILDEVFGETNFRNHIAWKRSAIATNVKTQWRNSHDYLLFYTKSDEGGLREVQYTGYSLSSEKHYNKIDEGGRFRTVPLMASGRTSGVSGQPWRGINVANRGKNGMHWLKNPDELERLDAENNIFWNSNGIPELKYYWKDAKGVYVSDFWDDISVINSMASEYMDYPTQKPELLLDRIIKASTIKGDIVLDAFAGSGTTAAVAEKLERRWIAIDSGKLAIYTTQKRLITLKKNIGATKNDDRPEPERVGDWSEHLKQIPSLFLITEKARKGECNITYGFLDDLARLINKHNLLRKDTPLSIICPEKKLFLETDQLEDTEAGPGIKRVIVNDVEFRISFVEKKEKKEKEKPLPASEFGLYRAGIYDMEAIKGLPWYEYRSFVLKLFGVRECPHKRYGFTLDGYLGTDSTLLWNYPEHKKLTIDYGYVDDLHNSLRGKTGERFYVIAPVIAMAFAEDEVVRDKTTYIFLKIPISILARLIESGEPAAFKQPTKQDDVNEVINAVGFDFISQPKVSIKPSKSKRDGQMFIDFVLEIREFRSQTLATDPEDFSNFETFSMAMIDLDYDGEVFQFSQVFWADNLLKEAGGLDKAAQLEIRIPNEEFFGKQMMIILCDRYGNEKTLVIKKEEFV